MRGIVAVTAKPHPATICTPHQLPGAALTSRAHLVDDKIEADRVACCEQVPPGQRKPGSDAIAGCGWLPAPGHHFGGAGRAARRADAKVRSVFGHDEKSKGRAIGERADVDLQAVAVDVVGFVVQEERWRIGWPEEHLGLGDVDREIEPVRAPGGPEARLERSVASPGLFAPAVLVLTVERERLGGRERLTGGRLRPRDRDPVRLEPGGSLGCRKLHRCDVARRG